MSKVSRDSASRVESMPGFDGRYIDSDGYTIGFERFDQDMDAAPFFKGLPDDRCQSPHWGYVFTGAVTLSYADGEEIISAGEAYYARPGHTPAVAAGTEIVEFSPTEEYAKTMQVVARNIENAG